MSGFELLLDNVSEMCKITIDSINKGNELSISDNTHSTRPNIATHLNDAYLNIETAKTELDAFYGMYDDDTRCKLLLQRHWRLKNNHNDIFLIREIDLRSMGILYSYFYKGTAVLQKCSIDRFLQEFE